MVMHKHWCKVQHNHFFLCDKRFYTTIDSAESSQLPFLILSMQISSGVTTMMLCCIPTFRMCCLGGEHGNQPTSYFLWWQRSYAVWWLHSRWTPMNTNPLHRDWVNYQVQLLFVIWLFLQPKFRLKFEQIYLSKPTHWEKDGAPSPMMPNEARLRNLT